METTTANKETTYPLTWDGRQGTARDHDACFSHCLAYLLGLPSIEVPNFTLLSQDTSTPGRIDTLARAWCAERGLFLISLPSHAPLDQLVTSLKDLNPGVPYILGGTSADEDPCPHAMVMCEGKVLCDPGGYGINAPLADGNFWVIYMGGVRWPPLPKL